MRVGRLRRCGAASRLPGVRRSSRGTRDADQPLDVAQIAHLLGAGDQRDRDAVGAGARGAADAVDIGFRDVGQVEIDHMADAVDVDAAGGDVGGDQRADLAGAERRQHALAVVLRLVAVDGVGVDAGLGQASSPPCRRRAWCG